MKRRVFAAALALCMALSLCAVSAAADETPEPGVYTGYDPVSGLPHGKAGTERRLLRRLMRPRLHCAQGI